MKVQILFSERECKRDGQNAFETNEKKRKLDLKIEIKGNLQMGRMVVIQKKKMFKEH